MALQDVCGFPRMASGPRWSLSALHCIASGEDNLCREISNQSGLLRRASWDRHAGSPLHLSLLPQMTPLPSSSSSSSSSIHPFLLSHGTTTLGFVFQGGVLAAADTRASCAGLIACPAAQKILPVHTHLVVTTSGSGADCMLWQRILAREVRLYQLRNRRCLSVYAAARLLSLMLHPFKGTDVCVAATLCGWDQQEAHRLETQSHGEDREGEEPPEGPAVASSTVASQRCTDRQTCLESHKDQNSSDIKGTRTHSALDPDGTGSSASAVGAGGPRVCYVCSDGLLLKGEVIAVGSGSPYAYAVLDDGWRWGMSKGEAVMLAREAVYRATHRDSYSGNNVDLFHITACGWQRRPREDLREEHYREREREEERMKEREGERGRQASGREED